MTDVLANDYISLFILWLEKEEKLGAGWQSYRERSRGALTVSLRADKIERSGECSIDRIGSISGCPGSLVHIVVVGSSNPRPPFQIFIERIASSGSPSLEQGIVEIGNAMFAPVTFSSANEIGPEADKLLKFIARKRADRGISNYPREIRQLRAKVSITLASLASLCFRATRHPAPISIWAQFGCNCES
ncbi:hypothetical protein GJ496_007823 [Pomphorhynchus laevis]|nr:hypothetical protein GJ496_007823 [Pomphorhynchus laevis]